MNLYKLTQSLNSGYDTYDSVIVAAENEHNAIRIHPRQEGFTFLSLQLSVESCNALCTGGTATLMVNWWELTDLNRNQYDYSLERLYYFDSDEWANTLNQVECELIGKAKEGTKSGVILSSYNAG